MSDNSQFSKREEEVTDLLLQGKSNKQIALALGISASTVEYHLKNVYKKLQVTSRTEAVLRLGKSIGGERATESWKSIVEINGETAENGGKPVSIWRLPMNKMFYFVGCGLLTIAAVAVMILANASRQNVAMVSTLPAGTTPAYAAMPTVQLNQTGTPAANPISITRVIDTEDSYILIGEFIPPTGAVLSDSCCALELFDGNGKLIVGENTWGIDPGTPTANIPLAFTWVEKFKKKSVILPVTIKATDLHWSSFTVPFEFDAGDNPQLDDEWQVHRPLEVSGMTATLETIHVIHSELPTSGGGYAFLVTYPFGDIYLDSISMQGYPAPINSGLGGGGSADQPAPTTAGMDYSVEFSSLPRGKLTVEFTFKVGSDGPHWTLPWQP